MPLPCSPSVLANMAYTGTLLFLLASVAGAQSPLPSPDVTDLTLSMADFEYQSDQPASADGLLGAMREKPGVALLGSAVLPGLGQAANRRWVRAGIYLLADALFAAIHINRSHQARRQEREYRQFADDNWSVVTYARWLVEYHRVNGLVNEHIDELEQQIEQVTPAYDPEQDWEKVDIPLLREAERDTPYLTPEADGNSFSHVMPAYGSQQYYELISKYYQYGPGWRNFGTNRAGMPLDNPYRPEWRETDMPAGFLRGAHLSEEFNDNYRVAGNMLSMILLNHVVSAFDAYLTVKIKNNRLEMESNPWGTQPFTLKYHF